jgi:hypothetical protein
MFLRGASCAAVCDLASCGAAAQDEKVAQEAKFANTDISQNHAITVGNPYSTGNYKPAQTVAAARR